uniref:Unannotated protein n=1 Tax=freshwater metagenome TaxID=449393 RepID=A0A6J7PFC3_9ZZZZ
MTARCSWVPSPERRQSKPRVTAATPTQNAHTLPARTVETTVPITSILSGANEASHTQQATATTTTAMSSPVVPVGAKPWVSTAAPAASARAAMLSDVRPGVEV